jgi:hypothetical protein
MLVCKHFQLIAITNKEMCILGITINLANALDTTLFAYSRVGTLTLFEIVWFVKLLQTWLWSMIPTVWVGNGCVQTTRMPSSFVFFLEQNDDKISNVGWFSLQFSGKPIYMLFLFDGRDVKWIARRSTFFSGQFDGEIHKMPGIFHCHVWLLEGSLVFQFGGRE